MKIIYDAGIDLSTFGGAVTHVIEKSRALIGEHVQVEIWAIKKPEQNINPKIKIVELIQPDFKRLRHLKFMLYEMASALKLLGIKKRDTVYLIRQRIYSLASLFVSRIKGIPVVYEVNDNTFDQLRLEKKLTLLKKIFIYFIYFWAMRFSSKVLTLTEDIKDYVADSFNLHRTKISVVPVGCNLGVFYPQDRDHCKRKLHLSKNKQYLLNVSTFTAWSGIDVIIRIMSVIKKYRDDVQVILVGDGRHKENYIKLANKLGVSDFLFFVGRIPYNDVPAYINASDLCFCVKAEGLLTTSPTRLFEYLSCGKPVIVTKGYKRTIDIESFIEITSDSVEDSAKRIHTLLDNKSELIRLGKISSKYAQKNVSWGTIARQITDCLWALIN